MVNISASGALINFYLSNSIIVECAKRDYREVMYVHTATSIRVTTKVQLKPLNKKIELKKSNRNENTILCILVPLFDLWFDIEVIVIASFNQHSEWPEQFKLNSHSLDPDYQLNSPEVDSTQRKTSCYSPTQVSMFLMNSVEFSMKCSNNHFPNTPSDWMLLVGVSTM